MKALKIDSTWRLIFMEKNYFITRVSLKSTAHVSSKYLNDINFENCKKKILRYSLHMNLLCIDLAA